MLTVDSARDILAQRVALLPPVELELASALGLRLAAAVFADIDLPHWDASAMDGYAVRTADLRGDNPLTVAFEVAAGVEPKPLPVGCVARIFTGAVVPSGADTVVEQERAVRLDDGRVKLEALPVWSNIRRKAEVLASGTKLADVGQRLTPPVVGLLASGGASRVKVHPRVRAAIVLTGSELVGAGETPKPGFIRDSNGPMLKALIEQAEWEFAGRTNVADDLEATFRVLAEAQQRADIILTSGGVSVGDWDFVPRAVEALGGEILFHKVAMKPGKPVLVAKLGSSWLVGLPGNAVSVLTGWRLFALPLGEALSGRVEAFREKPRKAIMTADFGNREGRCLFQPARLEQSGVQVKITPIGWKGSHDLKAAALADALLRVEAGESLKAGEEGVYYSLTSSK